LILQKAIESAGSIDTAKVKAALDKENMYTFFGHTKFDTGKLHGLQDGHSMIYIQWQKGKDGKPEKVAVWPPAAATGTPFLCPAR
jgi:branched-chain amino acid transport system substrate-binding protein